MLDSKKEGTTGQNLPEGKKSQWSKLGGCWHRGVNGEVTEVTEGKGFMDQVLYAILRNLNFIYYVCVKYLPCAQNCFNSQIQTQGTIPALKDA